MVVNEPLEIVMSDLTWTDPTNEEPLAGCGIITDWCALLDTTAPNFELV
jgi:hypothetical protein